MCVCVCVCLSCIVVALNVLQLFNPLPIFFYMAVSSIKENYFFIDKVKILVFLHYTGFSIHYTLRQASVFFFCVFKWVNMGFFSYFPFSFFNFLFFLILFSIFL